MKWSLVILFFSLLVSAKAAGQKRSSVKKSEKDKDALIISRLRNGQYKQISFGPKERRIKDSIIERNIMLLSCKVLRLDKICNNDTCQKRDSVYFFLTTVFTYVNDGDTLLGGALIDIFYVADTVKKGKKLFVNANGNGPFLYVKQPVTDKSETFQAIYAKNEQDYYPVKISINNQSWIFSGLPLGTGDVEQTLFFTVVEAPADIKQRLARITCSPTP